MKKLFKGGNYLRKYGTYTKYISKIILVVKNLGNSHLMSVVGDQNNLIG